MIWQREYTRVVGTWSRGSGGAALQKLLAFYNFYALSFGVEWLIFM